MKLYSFFLSTWHISLSITYSKSINFFFQIARFHSFWGWAVFHHIYYIYTYICRSMSLSIYHIFLHSPMVGLTGCFHDLTQVNKAAVNVGVHTSFWISVFIFFRHIPRSEIAGSYEVLVLMFWGNSILFLKIPARFMFLPTVCKCSCFSTVLPTFAIFCLFNNGHLKRYQVISHCGFCLHFLDD